MMREQIHNNMPPKGLIVFLLFGLLSGDRACPRERGHGTRDTGQTSPSILEIRGVRFEFVRIPAGEFVMGCDGDEHRKADPQGPHRLRVRDGQDRSDRRSVPRLRRGDGLRYRRGEGGHRCHSPGEGDWQSQIGVDWRNTIFPQSDDDPATFISWNDALAFCRWLSAESGREIRLPSEAEWEYACRAGTTGDYAGELNAMGWHRYNSGRRTHPVAQKQPNAWGLYDMHGNVWEWCLDAFALNYEGAPTDGSPRLRGGSRLRRGLSRRLFHQSPGLAGLCRPDGQLPRLQPLQQRLSPRAGCRERRSWQNPCYLDRHRPRDWCRSK